MINLLANARLKGNHVEWSSGRRSAVGGTNLFFFLWRLRFAGIFAVGQTLVECCALVLCEGDRVSGKFCVFEFSPYVQLFLHVGGALHFVLKADRAYPILRGRRSLRSGPQYPHKQKTKKTRFLHRRSSFLPLHSGLIHSRQAIGCPRRERVSRWTRTGKPKATLILNFGYGGYRKFSAARAVCLTPSP